MKNKSLIVTYISLIALIQGCATTPRIKTPKTSHAPAVEKTISDFSGNKKSAYELLDHHAFKVYYDKDLRMARYVVYELKAENLKAASGKRKNKFKVDPLLVEKKLPYVRPAEYKGSGYDQGHLAPAADFSWSQEAMDTTFVMSNMAPQEPTLNRGVWKKLEDKVRKWGCGEEHVTVITGPIFSKTDGALASGLVIPERFFKIVYDETPPVKMIAFIFNQKDTGDVINERRASIDEVESLTKFKVASVIPESTKLNKRLPASINDWREADCN